MQRKIAAVSVTMTSREIAELTGKRHSDVLRDIDNTVESLNADLRLGFKSSTYIDSTGKANRMYEMDRDSTQFRTYQHDFLDGRLISGVNLYPVSLLPEFRVWVATYWLPTHGKTYLIRKSPAALPFVSKMPAMITAHPI
jgi:hypothetical protein